LQQNFIFLKKNTLNNLLNFLISLTLGLAILYFVFKDVDISSYESKIVELNYSWIIFAMTISIFEYIIRAYRWNLLLEFNNKNLTVYKTTIGLIISYLSAIILPRINDIVRCYILSKTDKVKISVSIGSVITERIFDVISIFLLILLLLLFEFDRFYNYLMIEVVGNAEFDFLMFLLISILLIILIFYFIIIKFFHSSNYYEKFKEKVGELKSGMVSIFKMKKKIEFLISTIILWLLYFVVGYLIFFSMEETSHLGLSAALSILVAGALGTIVPVNAGIGAYHLFVASILIYYGIEYEDGLFFATILHGSQVITILFFGLVSLVLLYLDVFRKNK